MKRWFNSFLFSYRLAYKNIIKHPLRTFAIALSFLSLVIALFLSLSMREFLTTYFLGELEDKYQDIDVSVRVGQTGNARFFTIRPFNESLDREDYVQESAAFFTMDVLVEHEMHYYYIKSMSSDLNQLAKVTMLPSGLNSLLDQEVLITSSLSEKLNLHQGDTLTLALGELDQTYTIKDVMLDDGLFRGDMIFLNKSGSLSFFLTALDPTLAALPSFALTNLYNELYVNLKEDVSIQDFDDFMRDLNGYESLSIEKTINLQEIDEQISRSFSVFMVITIMVILAILLVLETSIKVYFNDTKKTRGLIHILGGRPSFSYRMVLYEFLLYIALSLLLGKFIAERIIRFGLYFVGGTGTFNFQSQTIYIVLAFTVIIFLFVSLKDDHQTKETSVIQSMREPIVKRTNTKVWIWMLLGVSTLMYILTFVLPGMSYISLYRLIYAVILLTCLPAIIYPILIRYQKDSIHKFHLSMLYQTKAFRHYLFVLLISGVSVLLLGLALGHMDQRYSIHREEFKIDYLMTNFVSRYDETLLEIQDMTGVKSADSMRIYENITLLESGDSILQTVSLDPDIIETYFNYEISEEAMLSLSNPMPTILLPNRFKEVYDLNIGDSISVSLHPEAPEVTLVIGGFFEKYLSNLAFTNLGDFNDYKDLSIQTIVITKDESTSDTLYEDLIRTYSPRLIYVVDYQAQVEAHVGRMERSTNYMALIIVAIIICFVISMMNHSLLMFEQMKKNYARMQALGMNRKQLILTLIQSGLTHLVIVFVISCLAYTLIALNMTDLILVSREYEKIHLIISPYVLGFVLTVLITFMVQLVYIYRILKLNPAPTLRLYE